jgi:two-component system sensor histidine kinase and response regulator WspE
MRVLASGLLALESGGPAKEHLASTMRAAHSIKGAARIVNLDVAVRLSHTMEDCLVAAQEGTLTLSPSAIDVLLEAGDLLAQFATLEESAVPAWVEEHRPKSDKLISQLTEVREGKDVESVPPELATEQLTPVPDAGLMSPQSGTHTERRFRMTAAELTSKLCEPR